MLQEGQRTRMSRWSHVHPGRPGEPDTGRSCDPFPRNGACARDEGHGPMRSLITPTGKPPPLAVRLEQALPFRRCVRGEDVLWGSPASQTIQKPQAQYHGEARSSGVVPRRVPSLNEECALMHPLQGASFLSTPLQGGILKPPALRVVGDLGPVEVQFLSPRCRGDARSPRSRLILNTVKRERKAVTLNPPANPVEHS